MHGAKAKINGASAFGLALIEAGLAPVFAQISRVGESFYFKAHIGFHFKSLAVDIGIAS